MSFDVAHALLYSLLNCVAAAGTPYLATARRRRVAASSTAAPVSSSAGSGMTAVVIAHCLGGTASAPASSGTLSLPIAKKFTY